MKAGDQRGAKPASAKCARQAMTVAAYAVVAAALAFTLRGKRSKRT
jgi:hypothetical protein